MEKNELNNSLKRTITIVSVVDVIQALASDTMSGNFYLMDNNKSNGSTYEGTEVLKTKVSKGDRLVWITQPMEVEVYISISEINIDDNYIDPQKKYYEGTDISYWEGEIKKKIPYDLYYTISFRVGSRIDDMLTSDISKPCLMGLKEE